MTMRTWASVCAVGILLLSAAEGQGQEFPRASTQYGAFAFPDLDGTHLLAVSDLLQPDGLHEALCSNGRRFSVRFERRQIGGDEARGRQATYVFDKVAGSVFTVLQGRIGQDSDTSGVSCFLVADSLRSSATWLPAERLGASGDCGSDVRRRLTASRARPVVNCWPIAALASGLRLILVEFARQGKDALASVVLIDQDRTVFADYPATFNGEGQDLWRADDGGALSPDGFRVVFVLQRANSFVLGMSWAASEGRSLTVFVSNNGNRFTAVITDYWYQAPV